MRICGIDPGLRGAVAILEADGSPWRIKDMPLRSLGKTRQEVDGAALARFLVEAGEIRLAVVEAVHAMAPGFGLDPMLVLAVIAAESAFDKTALSPKGAQGLMQLMPGTASRFGVQDAFDPEQNLRGGMTYLAWLLEQFPGRLDHAIAAYNAGEEAVEQYRGIPPYAETREYVRRVLGYYGVRGSKDKRG